MQTFKTSKKREAILGKIRGGLNKASVPIPFPEAEKAVSGKVFQSKQQSSEETFAEAFIQLGGKFVYCANEEELMENLDSLMDSRGWKNVLCSVPDLLAGFQNNKFDSVFAADANIENAEACITDCEYLVARTGSVFISSKQHLGRISTVYYPVHIIVAYTDQVVNDIGDGLDAIQKKYGSQLPSMINLNTGPSRTADIEKTLVVGVHGPKEVFCFLVHS